MKSYSQAGQDVWVREMLPGLTDGTFIDCGCCHPVELSNTYALEQLGWRGWLIDVDGNACAMCKQQRASNVICADGSRIDWKEALACAHVDYLSLDCDAATLDVLRAILAAGIKFKVATIEHDAYRFGDTLRAGQRALLTAAGYRLERADVHAEGYPDFPFEDWWVMP